MNLEQLRKYCHSKKAVTEEWPFGPDTLVFKVMGKMFILMGYIPEPESINLKCDPADSLALRAEFEGIVGGYHMNKRHWITVSLDSDVPEPLIWELIDDSYDLVVAKLPRRLKDQISS